MPHNDHGLLERAAGSKPVERGTINRGIYAIAVLFDPARPRSAVAPQPQWNGKVVYTIGASTGQPRLQFRAEQNRADDSALSRGFTVVDNSLTDSLYNSNRVLNAETLMMMKARIVDAANDGNHGDQVMWRYGTGLLPGTAAQVTAVTLQSLLNMHTWLTALLNSAPKATLNSVRKQQQVIAAKPATAFDLCYLTGDVNFTTKVTDFAVCDADPRLVKHASPRQVAGGALAEDILKCQLKPLNSVDFASLLFTSAQWARLQATFPDGVCDWELPGVGQQRAASPLTFADGPGGKRLPPAPQSRSAGREDDHHHDRDRDDRGDRDDD
ncbi:MAG: DUF6351 family protein [Burkholderiales bacterium]